MSQKPIIHSICLIVAIVLSFIFPKTPLAAYDIQFAALLFILLFVCRRFVPFGKQSERLLESIIFTLIITTTVTVTGGVNSPFFFLLYFLLFSLSLLLEPVVAITSTLTFVIFLLLSIPENSELSTLLPIFSLAFLTPFAILLGQMYIKSEKQKKENDKLKTTLSEDQENTYLFLSLMLKNHLNSIQTHIENFVGDLDLKSIRKHTQEMKRLIEKFENPN